MISMNKAPKLTPEERKMLNKSFYFSLGTNMASSKVSQQSKCFAMAMAPGLEMFYDDPEDRRKAFYRHAGEFFNTHQVFLGLLVGIALAMEKQQAEHPEDDITETISTLKASLMGPTAGIGDSFFWGTFRVIACGIGAPLAAAGNLLGVVLYLLLNLLPSTLTRVYGFKLGYQGGREFLAKIQADGTLEKVTEAAKILGLVVIGGLVPTIVAVPVSLQLNMGGGSFILADVLNSIMPNLLPLVLSVVVYHYIQKGVSVNKLLFLLLGLGILLTAVGFLPMG